MAVQRLHLARDSVLGEIGRDLKAVCACAAALLLLVTGVVAIHQWCPANGKQEANGIVSPLDKSLAPPAFVPSEAVKVKRATRVTVIPEKKRHRRRRLIGHRGTHTHAVGDPKMGGKASGVSGSSPRPAEPPVPDEP